MSNPFRPINGGGVSISVTTTSAGVNLGTNGTTVLLVNDGTSVCMVRIGPGAQTATTADMPIAGGAMVLVDRAESETGIAAITAAGTTTLRAIPGSGNSLQ